MCCALHPVTKLTVIPSGTFCYKLDRHTTRSLCYRLHCHMNTTSFNKLDCHTVTTFCYYLDCHMGTKSSYKLNCYTVSTFGYKLEPHSFISTMLSLNITFSIFGILDKGLVLYDPKVLVVIKI